MLLRGEDWPLSLRTTLGKRARKLYEELYGKRRSRKIRTHLMTRTSRNKVRTYPCGILEQAYRSLISEGAAISKAALGLRGSDDYLDGASRPPPLAC
jgi:hypothetical protein